MSAATPYVKEHYYPPKDPPELAVNLPPHAQPNYKEKLEMDNVDNQHLRWSNLMAMPAAVNHGKELLSNHIPQTHASHTNQQFDDCGLHLSFSEIHSKFQKLAESNIQKQASC